MSCSAPDRRTPSALSTLRALITLVLGLAGTPPAAAQDVEMRSLVTSEPLPTGYFERIALQPDFFEVKDGWLARVEGGRAAAEVLTGEFPLLVVLATFADSPEPTIDASELKRVLFDGPNPAGTLSEFYSESSGGVFTVRGEVSDWVRTGLTVAQVRGDNYGLGSDGRTGEFMRDALALADAAVDFAAFDNDGPDGVPNSGDDDGLVDALAVEFLESSITCAGQGPTIWAHRSRISNWLGAPYQSEDLGIDGTPIQADDYITQAAEECDGGMQTPVVIAHEFGHAIGLPDLYDKAEGRLPEQRNWVVGCWSIMAAGQWGCGPALAEGRWDRPSHFGPWEKIELGWLPNLEEAGDVLDTEFTLRPIETSGEALRVDLSQTEHLIIEYRDGSGFDANLPGTGILVHHVDETHLTSNGRCRTCERIYRTALLEADDDRSLLTPEGEGGSRGEAGDIFSDGGVHRLTNLTAPSTRLNSGAPSDVSIYRMEVVGGVARVTLSSRIVDVGRMLASFFDGGGQGPSPEEALYLDAHGNQNGRYDLGDFALYAREHPSVAARAGGGS